MEEKQHLRMPVIVDGVKSFSDRPFPTFVGARPGRIIPRLAELPASIFLNEEDFKKANLQVVVPGSWEFVSVHLQKFFTSRKTNIKYDILLKAIKRCLKYLPMFNAEMPTKRTMYHVNINPDALPGPNTGMFFPSKGRAAKMAFYAASKLWDAILEKGAELIWLPNQYSVGGRARRHVLSHTAEKMSDMYSLRESTSTQYDARLVQQPDFVPQLIQVPWQVSFAKGFHSRDVNRKSWVWLGRPMVYCGWEDCYKFGKFDTCLEGDWKEFDGSAPLEFIIAAFAIIASYFPFTYKTVSFFALFCENFLNRRIVTPGDHTYFVSGGIPSGSIWTSDVGTIVNILLWCYILEDTDYFKSNTEFTDSIDGAFCGDDFLLGWMSGGQLSLGILGELEDYVLSTFGMEIKGLRVGKSTTDNDEDCLSILKTSINVENQPTLRYMEIIKRVNTPERNPYSTWDKWNSMAVQIPAPGHARSVFFRVLDLLPGAAEQFSLGITKEIFGFNVDEKLSLVLLAEKFYDEVVCGCPSKLKNFTESYVNRFSLGRFCEKSYSGVGKITDEYLGEVYLRSFVPYYFSDNFKPWTFVYRHVNLLSIANKKRKAKSKLAGRKALRHLAPDPASILFNMGLNFVHVKE